MAEDWRDDVDDEWFEDWDDDRPPPKQPRRTAVLRRLTMQQPLCSNTDDGACPNFALNGIEVCLVHAPIARDSSGFTIDIGYRPGGIGTAVPPPDFEQVLVGLQAEFREAFELARRAAHLAGDPVAAVEDHDSPAGSASWTAKPPPARRHGWLAAALNQVFR